MVLGHELDHVHEAATNSGRYIHNYNVGDPVYERREERRVILGGAEASMLKTFYNENPRSDYKIDPYPVDSPLDR